MDVPKEIEKWLVFDEKKFEYVLKEDAPKEIKKAYQEYLIKINDFILI